MSVDPDRIRIAVDGPEVEIKVRGSRFPARVAAVADARAAAGVLDRIRRAHHGASHHCWAARWGDAGASERFDDDGEPSGTAGRPILDVLRGADVTDGVVVVTRYFGGTKLGTGGLSRAYGDAARAALDAAGTAWRTLTERIEVRCAFDQVGAVEAVLARGAAGIESVDRTFEDGARFVVTAHRSRADDLAGAIVDATSGRASIAR